MVITGSCHGPDGLPAVGAWVVDQRRRERLDLGIVPARDQDTTVPEARERVSDPPLRQRGRGSPASALGVVACDRGQRWVAVGASNHQHSAVGARGHAMARAWHSQRVREATRHRARQQHGADDRGQHRPARRRRARHEDRLGPSARSPRSRAQRRKRLDQRIEVLLIEFRDRVAGRAHEGLDLLVRQARADGVRLVEHLHGEVAPPR